MSAPIDSNTAGGWGSSDGGLSTAGDGGWGSSDGGWATAGDGGLSTAGASLTTCPCGGWRRSRQNMAVAVARSSGSGGRGQHQRGRNAQRGYKTDTKAPANTVKMITANKDHTMVYTSM